MNCYGLLISLSLPILSETISKNIIFQCFTTCRGLFPSIADYLFCNLYFDNKARVSSCILSHVSKDVPLSRWPPPCMYAHAQIHMLRTSRVFISIYRTITRQWGVAASVLVELVAFLYTNNTSKLRSGLLRQAGRRCTS